jgi:hypothetical protein
MTTTVFKSPTMIVDGKVTMVTRDRWAQIKLSAEDYAKYQTALVREKAIWDEATANGEVELIPMIETQANGVRKIVGTQTVLNNFAIPSDSEFQTFYQQFLADPDLTWPT